MAKLSVFKRKHPPRSITICDQKIAVKVVAYLEDSDIELLGAFNSETKTIFLMKGCDWPAVLFHECCHAALYFSGASQGISASKEESIVLIMEHCLFPLLKDIS